MRGDDKKTTSLISEHNKVKSEEMRRGLFPGGSTYNTVMGDSDDTAQELGMHVLRQYPAERKPQEENTTPLLRALNEALMPSTQADEDSDYETPWEERKENALNRDPDDFHSI